MTERYTSPERLAELLDRSLPPGVSSIAAASGEPLVEAAAQLARLRLPTLAPRTSTRIEGRVMGVYNQQYRRHQLPTRSLPTGLVAVGRYALVAGVLMILLVGALTPAFAASVPGDPLYPIKQLYERVELATATSPAAQATVQLAHAERRTQEALTLLDRHQFNADLIDAALANIAAANQVASEVRASAQLRAEVLQVQSVLDFVLTDAWQSGLTTQASIRERVEAVQQLRHSDLLLSLPAQEHNPNVMALADTPTPTETATPTPTPTCENGRACLAPGLLTQTALAPTCENGRSCLAPGLLTQAALTATCENGRSCLSHGTPGATSTPRPTHVPPTRQPTKPAGSANTTGSDASAAQGNAGGNSANAGANSNAGGNSSNAAANSGDNPSRSQNTGKP